MISERGEFRRELFFEALVTQLIPFEEWNDYQAVWRFRGRNLTAEFDYLILAYPDRFIGKPNVKWSWHLPFTMLVKMFWGALRNFLNGPEEIIEDWPILDVDLARNIGIFVKRPHNFREADTIHLKLMLVKEQELCEGKKEAAC